MYPTNVDHQQNIFKIGNPSGEPDLGEKEKKKVAYRAPAALCCWLFDVAILSLTLLCIAPFLKEASVQATNAFTFYYMSQRHPSNHSHKTPYLSPLSP